MTARTEGDTDIARFAVVGGRARGPVGLEDATRAATGDLPEAEPRGGEVAQTRAGGIETEGVALRPDQLLAGRGVPEPGRPIPARRDKKVVGGVEVDEDDRPIVTFQGG